jgi:UDP-glucose 4-epimerase
MHIVTNKVLVTGGAGYIGSHTCVALLEAGYEPLIYDNFCNSSELVLERLKTITGRELTCVRGDLRDRAGLDSLFAAHEISAVVHFAGLKAVGESVSLPLAYYQNNVAGTLTLLEAMGAAQVTRLVFSSSATVYGDPASNPVCEDFPRSATNPYGATKLMIEDILRDLVASDPQWSVACLRYFNPVGAHPSGLIGEDPQGIPNNLMPYVSQVAVGQRERLQVFGGDYPTVDGTGVRDYIHVLDLAAGHVAALQHVAGAAGVGFFNLGVGRGVSVLEMVAAFEAASGRPVPYDIVARRPGDVATCYADASLAQAVLNWRALRSVEEMCADAWRWQQANPEGYR